MSAANANSTTGAGGRDDGTIRLRVSAKSRTTGAAPPPAGWTVKSEFAIGVARDGGVAETISAAADDVFEITLEDGTTLYLRADEAGDWLKLGRPSRDAVSGEAALDLGTSVAAGPGETAQRDGLRKWVIKSLRVFGDGPTAMTAITLAGTAQDKLLGTEPGIYRCATDRFALTPVPDVDASDGPILLFLHGTASSTQGSFGHLWSSDADDAAALFKPYGRNVYALQHRTLTESPIRNALDAARKLPAGARLHVISHSRGGMVGELLARGGSVGKEPIEDADLRLLRDRGERENADALAELREVLRTKRIVVERFVRVACPARGTTLASERLDRWANVALNVLRMVTTKVVGIAAGAVAAPLGGAAAASLDSGLEAFNSFLLAVVKERTNASALPGAEAMMPGSATVKLLNRPGVTVAGKLYVIAGDYAGDTMLTRFGNWISDTFYGGENDLVVNTASMTGGAQRVDGMWRAYFQGPHTHHLRYFEETDSRRQLRIGLDGNLSGYERWDGVIEPPIARSARGKLDPQTANSVVFLLPGIMGSHLGIRSGENAATREKSRIDRIWFDPLNLFGGEIKRLQIGGPEDANVHPDGLFDAFYGNLRDRLCDQHAVIDFPFDWRHSMQSEGKRFGAALQGALAKTGRAVRIVAHSMGGLIVRMAFVKTPGLWDAFATNPSNRILMLGTPNQGSHGIVSVLLGRDDFVRKIDRWFDFEHDIREFLHYVSGFPGVLELLPAPSSGPERDYFDAGQWENVLKANDKQDKNGQPQRWVPPLKEKLAAAQATWELLDQWAAKNPSFAQKVLYVAGRAPTPIEIQAANGAIDVLLTSEGDGRVPWRTGLMGGQISRVWYADCAHGDLPGFEEAFDGYLELIESGTTSRLPTTPPAERAASAAGAPKKLSQPAAADEIFPSPSDIMAAALGARPRIRRRKVTAAPALRITVKHGSFGYSDDPVMIGHYEGNTIEGSEAYLDRLLDGNLSRSRDLRIHPQRPGDAAVFLASDPYARPPGGVVVGLGRVGELTPGSLAMAVRQGALAYINRVGTDPGAQQGDDPLRLATTIIGSGFYGLNVRDALAAILAGLVEANTIIARQPDRRLTPIAEVSIFERRLDRALSAVASTARLADDTRFKRTLRFEPRLHRVDGGMQATQISDLEGAWQRIQVLEHKGVLSYTVLSEGARNNINQQVTQQGLIEQLVDRTIAHTEENPRFSRALFELLVPADLKQGAPENIGITMMVDSTTARYPWEMLRDIAADAPGSEPLAARIGFLRQFHAVGLVTNVHHPKSNCALVVGDPTGPLNLPEFAPLPGARSEAAHVADQLEAKKYRVTREIAQDGQIEGRGADIVTTLVGNEFRIMHLSGHGVIGHTFASDKCDACGAVKPADDKMTGMVLDEGVLFTKAEVDALPYVPELVFINCCHLGRIGGKVQAGTFDIGRATLATGLAEAFVRKGAKAVVAAGWAVDDGAAVTFAETFYERFLNGETFGAALKQARQQTYQKHPSVNTWGAYQAYGSDSYCIAAHTGGDAEPMSGGQYFDAHQVLEEVGNIRADASLARADALPGLMRRLSDVEAQLAPDDTTRARIRSDAQVQEALGHTWAELGRFDRALEYFEQAVQGTQKNVGMRLFEQRANMLARHGWNLIRQAGDNTKQVDAGLKSIESGIDAASNLVKFMPTPERYCILASACKRKALGVLTARPDEVDAALEEMANAYGHAIEGDAGDDYAFLNWVQGRVIAGGASEISKDAIDRIVAIAARKGGSSFWVLTYPADAALTLRMLSLLSTRRSKPAAPTLDEIKMRYRRLLRRAGTPRESASVIDQLDSLKRLNERKTGAPKGAANLAKELTEILDALAGEMK